MSIVKEIGAAVEREVTWLCRMEIVPLTIPVPSGVQAAEKAEFERGEDAIGKYVRRKDAVRIFRNSHDARHVLRIEVTLDSDADYALMEHAMKEGSWRSGEPLFHGVSVYLVRSDIEGGWRIINPMNMKKA